MNGVCAMWQCFYVANFLPSYWHSFLLINATDSSLCCYWCVCVFTGRPICVSSSNTLYEGFFLSWSPFCRFLHTLPSKNGVPRFLWRRTRCACIYKIVQFLYVAAKYNNIQTKENSIVQISVWLIVFFLTNSTVRLSRWWITLQEKRNSW